MFQQLSHVLAPFWSQPILLGFLSFIIGVFLVGLLLLEFPLLKRSWQLKGGVRRCHKIVKSRNPERLQECRAQVVRVLSQVGWLFEPVRQFDKAWRGAVLSEDQGAVGPIELLDFLPPQKVLPRIANRHMALVVPGILVASGIVGTFVGLVLGLPGIGSPDIGTDPGELRVLVSTITQSLGLAFWTSIAGISLSMVFLAIDRLMLHLVETKVIRLSELTRLAFPVLTDYELARLQHSLLTQSAENIQTLGTDISAALVDALEPAFDRAVSQHMAPAIQAIQESVEQLVSFSADEQLSGLQQLVDRFMDSMQSELGGQFDALGEVLDTTIRSQSAIGAGLEEFSRQLRGVSEVQQDLIMETTRAAETLRDSLDRLELIAQMLNAAAEKITDAGAELERSAVAATEAQRSAFEAQEQLVGATRVHSQAMSEAREGLMEAWGVAVEQAKGAIFQIQEATRELSSGIGDQLVNALQSFDGALGETINRFSGTLAQVDGSIGELPPAAQAIRESCESLEQRTSDVLRTLESTRSLVEGIVADNVGDAVEAAGRLEQVARVSADLVERSGQIGTELGKTAEELSRTVSGFEGAQTGFAEFDSTMKGLSSNLSPINESLTTISSSLDGGAQVAGILDRLTDITTALEALTRTMEQTREQVTAKKRSFFGFGGRG